MGKFEFEFDLSSPFFFFLTSKAQTKQNILEFGKLYGLYFVCLCNYSSNQKRETETLH